MSLSVAGIVLAGGLSRRRGGVNKATQMLGSQTLLAHTIDQLSEQISPIAINANDEEIRLEHYPIIKDSLKGFLIPLRVFSQGLNGRAIRAIAISSASQPTPLFSHLIWSRAF